MIGWVSALAVSVEALSLQPTDPRLEAFKAACLPHRQDLAKTAEALAADGWARVDDDDHPRLAAAMVRARAEAVDPQLQMTADFSVWARTRDGLRFHVVLNRVDAVSRSDPGQRR